MKMLKKSDVIRWLHSYACEFELPYEEREDDVEDGLPHTLRMVANIIQRYVPDELNREEF